MHVTDRAWHLKWYAAEYLMMKCLPPIAGAISSVGTLQGHSHDGDALAMNGAQVAVLKQGHLGL